MNLYSLGIQGSRLREQAQIKVKTIPRSKTSQGCSGIKELTFKKLASAAGGMGGEMVAKGDIGGLKLKILS